MLIYIILYSMLLPGILYDAVRKSLSAKKAVLGFYVLLFTLFRGLRWNTGTDWSQYLWHFQYLNIDNVFSYSRYGGDETLEPLYALINVLVGFVGNYSLFLLVTNLFVLYTYYWFSIKYTPKPVVTFALLLLCASFFPVRMELAVTVLMWTIPSLVHKDFKSFLFVTFLAFFIHKATIVYLPFYWLLHCRFGLFLQIGLYTVCTFMINEALISKIILLLSLLIPISSVQVAAQNYLHSNFDYGLESVVSGSMSYVMAVSFLVLMHYSPIQKENILYRVSVNAYLFMSCISQVIPESLGDLGRVGGCFIWGLPIAFSFITECYLKTRFKYITFMLLVLYCVYKFIRLCSLFPAALFPYYSIFDSPPYVR